MIFTPISFPDENIQYLTPGWDDLNQLAFTLAKAMIKAGEKFDRIITLAKGGWPMTRSLVDFLSLEKVASLGIKFYSGINRTFAKPKIYQDLPVKVTGENILLFDDVTDTGHSLKFTQTHLKAKGAKTITTATLFYKPRSVIKPDYFGFTTDAWIIFPYEVVEAMKSLANKWAGRGVTQTAIQTRFVKLNFPRAIIKFYGSKI